MEAFASVQVFTITARKNGLLLLKVTDALRSTYTNYFYLNATTNVTFTSNDTTPATISVKKMDDTNKVVHNTSFTPPTITLAPPTQPDGYVYGTS